MNFVMLRDVGGDDLLVNLDRVHMFGIGDDGKSKADFGDATWALSMSPAEVLAAIRQQCGGGKPTVEPPSVAEPPEAEPIPLEVGQVWRGRAHQATATISVIEAGRVWFAGRNHLGEGWANSLSVADFRDEYPDPVSPAPKPELAPEADPVALLAEGKRLRYQRDAGPVGSGDRLGSTVHVALFDRLSSRSPKLSHAELDGPVWIGAAASFSDFDLHNADIAGQPWCIKRSAASAIEGLLGDLGYRFAGLADDE